MRVALLLLLVLLGGWRGLNWVHTRNAAVQTAAQAYRQADFITAATYYKRALAAEGSAKPDETILLNLAHASARAGQLAAARAYYSRLLTSSTAATRSIAQQQLGVLEAQRGEYAQSLRLLRLALLSDASNTGARYDYEVVSRLVQQQPEPEIPPAGLEPPGPKPPTAPKKSDKDQQPTPQLKPKPGQDHQGEVPDTKRPDNPQQPPQSRPDAGGRATPQNPGNPAGAGAQGNVKPGNGAEQEMAQGQQPGSTRGLGTNNEPSTSAGAGTENAADDVTQLQTQRARLQQMQLSPAQARQLLDALRSAEQQYIQQLPRRSTHKAASNKPAW